MKIKPTIWERRKNGTFSVEGLSYGAFNCIPLKKKTCPVCCECLGHDNELELYKTEEGLFWICNCWYEKDCGFAYPDGLTEGEILNLVEERKRYLNSLGIGIMHYKVVKK